MQRHGHVKRRTGRGIETATMCRFRNWLDWLRVGLLQQAGRNTEETHSPRFVSHSTLITPSNPGPLLAPGYFYLETTRMNAPRAIPPALGHLIPSRHPSDIQRNVAADLLWLSKRHPQHEPFFERWRGLFDQSNPQAQFATAKWLLSEWRKKGHGTDYLLRGLRLTDDQQCELAGLVGKKAESRRSRIERERQTVMQRIESKHLERGLQLGSEGLATLRRRYLIWECANVAKWRPQATARYYEALTGQPISRALAFKIMDELRRDLGTRACR